MPISLEAAKNLKSGMILRHDYARQGRNASEPQRWRVSGKVKTWKRDPSRIEIPLKHGLYWHRHLTEADLHTFSIVE